MQWFKIKTFAWYTLLCACLVLSLVEINQLMRDWARRPVDIVEDIRPIQEIPFPSVTICPEGRTSNPAIEMYFNKKQLSYRAYPKTVKSYLYIQIDSIRLYMSLLKEYKTSSTITIFSNYIKFLVSQAVEDNQLSLKVSRLCNLLEDELNPKSEDGQLCQQVRDQKPDGENFDNKTLAALFVNLGVKKVALIKHRQNKVNMVKVYLAVLRGKEVETEKFDKIPSFPIYTGKDNKRKSSVTMPPLLTLTHVRHAEEFWNLSSLSETWSFDRKKVKKYLSTLDLLSIYMQLVYLQTENLNINLGSKMVHLSTYDNNEYVLSNSSVCDHLFEIDQLLKNETSNVSSEWNLLDIINLLTIQGSDGLFGYSRQLKKYKCSPSFYKHNGIDDLARWIGTMKEASLFCETYSEKQLCKHLNETTAAAQHTDLLELLHNTAHPPTYTHHQSLSMHPMSAVPICFIGKQVSEVLTKMKVSYFSEAVDYTFCTTVQHVYTDAGLCTTINFPDQANLFHKDYLAIKDKEITEVPLQYPKTLTIKGTQVQSFKQLDDGIQLVLDSCAFSNLVSTSRNNLRYTLKTGNGLFESDLKNNFKAMLHDKNEIPTQLQPQSVTFNIEKNEDDVTMPFIRVKVKVYIDDADESIRSLSTATRGCRFEDETQGLKMFKVYSETNCMYECKVRLAKEKCGCVPWNFPHLPSDSICNIIGNICFSDYMFWLLDNMHSLKTLGAPPCGCYPSCRRNKYVFVGQDTEKAGYNWLDTKFLLDTLNRSRQENKVADFDSVETYPQYMTPFFLQSIFPTWSQIFPQREASMQLKYLYPNEVARNHGAIKTQLEDRIKNLALLHINFDREHYQARTKTKRTSFSMMLSSFGGILGLFTGFSLMALFDVCCWLKASAKKTAQKINV